MRSNNEVVAVDMVGSCAALVWSCGDECNKHNASAHRRRGGTEGSTCIPARRIGARHEEVQVSRVVCVFVGARRLRKKAWKNRGIVAQRAGATQGPAPRTRRARQSTPRAASQCTSTCKPVVQPSTQLQA